MTNWDAVPWTPFEQGTTGPDVLGLGSDVVFINSRYQVTCRKFRVEPFGDIIHLSIKTHDRAPRHDWRDFQRIKNEIVGPSYDAIEIYPDEAKLVDTSNQYHLWVLLDHRLEIGYQTRLVAEGSWQQSQQRPFGDQRPPDCKTAEELTQLVDKARARC